MDFGEVEPGRELDLPLETEHDALYEAEGLEVSLWDVNIPRTEIFPPFEALVTLTPDKMICRKKRCVRQNDVAMPPEGLPYPTVVHIPKKRDGWQWFACDFTEISIIGRTYLLGHRIVINSDSGIYEAVINKGKQAKELIHKLTKFVDEGPE
jgi:hypothetical protein